MQKPTVDYFVAYQQERERVAELEAALREIRNLGDLASRHDAIGIAKRALAEKGKDAK